jgi:hypothetical protein
VRLQLSMLFVPMATRVNFCAMKFTSFVAFEQENTPEARGPVGVASGRPDRGGAIERLAPRWPRRNEPRVADEGGW